LGGGVRAQAPDDPKRSLADEHLQPEPKKPTPPEEAPAPRRVDPTAPISLSFAFREDNATALEVQLPAPVLPGESVTLDLAFTLRLPQKQGRWGQWKGVTFLAQWLPVVAVHDSQGWQPPPFIPWHQPFFNEAGVYKVSVTLPADQKLAASAAPLAEKDLGDGRRQVELAPICTRDFALFCSTRFEEFVGQAGHVQVRCVAFKEHEFYARELVRIATEAIPVYERWFGPYPYPQFTIVESYFGWNGNECGGLVMIDERIFNMPHLARNFVDYLVSHEICHQWWYNVVGTNGYSETWMDEGVATYFGHRLMTQKYGRNNNMLTWPEGLGWLPNIKREDYRHYGMIGTMGRGELTATVQDMPGFGHLVNLNSIAYDRGSKIVGMIEERLRPDAMLDFMHRVYHKYAFRILRVADFQRELEAYTGYSWEEFFQNWLYSPGMSDWCLEDVRIERLKDEVRRVRKSGWFGGDSSAFILRPCKVTVLLHQKGKCNEPTVLGFRLGDDEIYQVRIPILANSGVLQIDDLMARVESFADNRVRVEVVLPCRPTQIAVDPDQVLLDSNPNNNYWKPRLRIRVTPFCTTLDETDITTNYDRLNLTIGPWFYGASYHDPWYTRSTMLGLRAGVYQTQEVAAGAYLAYRTDDRNVVAGIDGIWDHWPFSKTQVGFNVEHSLGELDNGRQLCSRAVLFGRYIFMYGDSLYLPPFHYVELFGSWQENALPDMRGMALDAPGQRQSLLGLHYHLYLLTPYWNPEGGIALDATAQEGFPILGSHTESHQAFGQFSTVKSMPGWLNFLKDIPHLAWLTESRVAFRLWGAAALPNSGRYFTLGGGEQFRGFDLRERQGSLGWIASAEWRVPLLKGVEWDVCDHIAGLRNVYGALFYDVGNMYEGGHQVAPIAHAVGLGLRLDVAWFGLIERTMLRFDAAKTINGSTPWQFWFGVQYPF